MGDNFNTPTTPQTTTTWLTAPSLIKALGHFDLDPCCPPVMPWATADRMNLWPASGLDGLAMEWQGRVWLNPPYGAETWKWLEKLAAHDGGGIALTFARTGTGGFHDFIFDRAHSIFFFRGRQVFHHADGSLPKASANADSVLVSYREEDTIIIAQAKADGKIKGRQVLL